MPIKIVALSFYISFMIFVVFVWRELLCILVMIIAVIFGGMFGFSFEVLCELKGIKFLLGLLFFPVTMMIGIGVAFRELLWWFVPELLRNYGK